VSDLWQASRDLRRASAEPLAVRLRPRSIDEVEGQEHLLGPGKLLRRMLTADAITSIILHGPPGTGKTTLAEVIARHTRRTFERENAASVGVKRIREIVDAATHRLERDGTRTILFLDEIHRFTKAQQDVLLADVERGVITLIGATTENPLFAVNSALVSRSTLFRLEPLSPEAILRVLRRAISDADRGFGRLALRVSDEALALWADRCDGDARRALTALEVAVRSSQGPHEGARHDDALRGDSGVALRSAGNAEPRPGFQAPQTQGAHPLVIDRATAEDSIQQKAIVYDGTGDGHYDTISAFIKSVRASDPDAALYWLAHMLEAGEDPRFIARRLSILASEDIGNADPRAIMVASAAWELVERLGMPEGRITLAQCTTYLSLAPKSNASYVAIDEALADVREGRSLAVPMHIKDGNVRKAASLSGMKTGAAYAYTHEVGVEDPYLGRVGAQDYLTVEKTYYRPTAHGMEKLLGEALARARAIRAAHRSSADPASGDHHG
jgi:putative ATPase